ncbi:hypothetical protein P886_1989 [Alteromonadaceae bacterium 2753L.S.0a.02]|nr:hypothetical protein P886_1989 [Alteromonadaceae bacterium 2753L.S.0a.02]
MCHTTNKQHQVQPLHGLDLRFGASRLHYGPCAGRYAYYAL